MQMTRAGLAAVVIPIVAMMALTGCGGSGSEGAQGGSGEAPSSLEERDREHLPPDWADVEKAATEEGEVVVYTTTPAEQFDPIVAAFNNIYPDITVTRVSDALSTLAVRYEQERSSGTHPADILASSSFEAMIEAHHDWFTDIGAQGPALLPNLADFGPLALPKDRPRSVTLGAYTWRVAYNTGAVEEADLPKTFEDLTNPRWAKVLGVVDPRNSDTYASVYEALRQKYGDGYLSALAKNGFGLTKEATDTAQQVGAGVYPIGFPTNQSKAASFIDAGAPMKLLDLAPYPIGATTMALPLNAPHPNAARLFANFLLTAQAQELECELVKVGSLNKKAGGPCEEYKVPDDATLTDFSLSPEVRQHVFQLMGLN
jgi:iron(III) transport system substrate-binding protein